MVNDLETRLPLGNDVRRKVEKLRSENNHKPGRKKEEELSWVMELKTIEEHNDEPSNDQLELTLKLFPGNKKFVSSLFSSGLNF